MKLTAVLIFAFTFNLHARSFSQKITIVEKNIPILKAFRLIEKQTGYSFLYEKQFLKKAGTVSLHVKNGELTEVLNRCFSGQPLDYEIKYNTIIVREREKEMPAAPHIRYDTIPLPPAVTILGNIKDESGKPLAGVSVKLKGTEKGTATDADGNFTLTVPPDAILQISSIGYEDKEVPLKGQTVINITLSSVARSLSDVVVVAYGTQKKLTVTGSVATIKGAELVTTKNENIQHMMTGKLPGVRVAQKSSEPGTFNTIFDIRGFGTPLVVIDGVPRDNITRLDPNEIESVSVLKDAEAAVYGVRAANGVVLITTKKGKPGKMELQYSLNYGIQEPLGLPQVSDAVGQMTLVNEKSMTRFDNPQLTFSDAFMEPYIKGEKKTSDWNGTAMNKTAPMYQHNLSASGSTNLLSYFFNFGYLKQQGLWKSNDLNYDKYNFRANIDASISKRLKTDLKVSGILDNQNRQYIDTWEVFKSLWRQSSLSPVFINDNPMYPGEAFDAANTVVMTSADQSGYRKNMAKWFQSSLGITYEIPYIKGLNLRGVFSYDYNSLSGKNFRKEYTLYTYDEVTDTYSGSAAQSPSTISRSISESNKTLLQASLNYQRAFDVHHVAALLLYEEGNSSGDNFNAGKELSILIDQLFAGNSKNQQAGMDIDGLYRYANKGLVGRVNYDFDTRYLAEFSFRYDGSSRFTKTKQWGFFPAFSVGWVLSNEKFIRGKQSLSWIDNLKLRASYGEMGDDGAIAFQFISGYDYPSGGYIWDGRFVNGIGFRGVPNPNITWSTSRTTNIGFEASLWKKVGVEIDVFQRNRSGLLTNRLLTLPGTVGINLPQENLNSDRTRGWEAKLSYKNQVNALTYQLTGIFSYTLSQNRYVERAASGNSWSNWRNNPSNRNQNIWWGNEVIGSFKSYDEVYSYKVNQGDGNKKLLPGDWIYEDWNGDGVIDDNDNHPIALTGIPLVNASIGFSGAYKGIDLNFLFQGSMLSYTEIPGQLMSADPWGGGNTLTLFENRWHPVDPKADRYDPNTQWIAGGRPALGRPKGDGTTVAIQNASYVRLKTIELGYTLPARLLSKVGIGNVRVYVNSYNLFTLTRLDYIDPERPVDDYGMLYPVDRVFNFGFHATF